MLLCRSKAQLDTRRKTVATDAERKLSAHVWAVWNRRDGRQKGERGTDKKEAHAGVSPHRSPGLTLRGYHQSRLHSAAIGQGKRGQLSSCLMILILAYHYFCLFILNLSLSFNCFLSQATPFSAVSPVFPRGSPCPHLTSPFLRTVSRSRSYARLQRPGENRLNHNNPLGLTWEWHTLVDLLCTWLSPTPRWGTQANAWLVHNVQTPGLSAYFRNGYLT